MRWLVLVMVLGPIVAVGVSIGAGCVALVWFYTEIVLGDKSVVGGVEYRGFEGVVGWWWWWWWCCCP